MLSGLTIALLSATLHRLVSHQIGCTAGSAAVAQPQIDLSAVTAAANAAFGETLSPPFTYQANDITGLLSAFTFEDVGVTAYNGAAPLLTSKSLLAAAVSIGLVEGYHAGIVSICMCCAPCPFSQSHSLLHIQCGHNFSACCTSNLAIITVTAAVNV